ncbi:hypothetical protein E1890_24015 [Salmonella enterica subsp. enterica serovar Mountpleasant]|nr:hypothetical protein [Salmonella enterica subsp. enterica serovar Mountpleasant]
MAFGIYLEDEYGNPWYWDACRNFQLIEKRTHNGVSEDISYDTGVSNSRPCFVFMQVTWVPDITSMPLMYFGKGSGGKWYYGFSKDADSPGAGISVNVNVFIFSDYAPTLPRYGIAIWDEKGNLAITSESKLLRIAGTLDCRVIGERKAIAGSYAIMPMVTAEAYFDNLGLDSVIGDPSDEASQVEFGTSAHTEGGITVLTNGLAKAGDPNSWGQLKIINGRYDWFQLHMGPEGKNIINTPIPYINADEYL